MEELIIDEANFHEYFHDVRTNVMQEGQVMVVYEAIAELVDGTHKKDLVNLLCQPDKAISAKQFMKSVLFATERESVRIPKEILQDLKTGMSIGAILNKNYKYKMEMFFYARPENIPNDPHWKNISLLNDFFDDQEKIQKITI